MEYEWNPATLDEVNLILLNDLKECDEEQKSTFAAFKVAPFRALLTRFGRLEEVYVVAIKDGEAIYWEDVEEGFNVSPISSDNSLLNRYCNQDPLGVALNSWIEGRSRMLPQTLIHRETARNLAALGGTQPGLKQIPRRRAAK